MKRHKKQTKSVKGKETSCVTRQLQHDLHTFHWVQAAEDARLKIKEHQKKIRSLKQAARVFEKYAQQGERWPQRASISLDDSGCSH